MGYTTFDVSLKSRSNALMPLVVVGVALLCEAAEHRLPRRPSPSAVQPATTSQPRRGAPFRNGFGFFTTSNGRVLHQIRPRRLTNGLNSYPVCGNRAATPLGGQPPGYQQTNAAMMIQGTEACDGSESFDNDCRSFGYVGDSSSALPIANSMIQTALPE